MSYLVSHETKPGLEKVNRFQVTFNMEGGAGKHWTEEGVKALLSGQKKIYENNLMDYRNKGIFIYIAKRLQALGVYRDWQQCQVQDKNLKHEYRTVTYALSSGDSSKTMEFFHDLNGILQCEPAIQLKGRCEWQMPGNDEPKSSPRND